jgi:Zn-dependent M16 (insulinase) family peptidase
MKGEHPSFKLVRTEMVAEYGVPFTLYRHVATGAEVLSVETEDDNKVFGIAFRTPASDNTGVPHIMEHSVLCGSDKYPVKDPFIQLRRTSLQTYLNAFTYPDRTVYPVASQNLKDFYNLANVYLDAVLHPRAVEDPMVLAQEGWHYELDKESDPLTYKGIVFNEMKGGYSSADQRLHREAMRQLFPNTTYRFDSAGDPREMPTLTFEKFQAFYKQYYHPSNARIFFYGDDSVDKRLALLDSYLAEFGKPPKPVEVTRIETQKKWTEPRKSEIPYPVGQKEASAAGGAKHTITLYWILNEDALPHVEGLGMSMITHLLLGTATSPLHKALTKSGYGDSVTGGGFSDDLKQATFSVGLKGIKKEDTSKVETLIMDTIVKVVKDGFDDDAVEATMNSIDFSVREFSSASSNRGLSLYLSAMTNWLYERDPVEGLKFEAPLKEIKAKLAVKGSRWLEGLVEEMLINNKHRLIVEGVPDSSMGAREEAAEKEKLASKKKSLSQDALAKMVKDTADLKKAQKLPDTQEQIDTLPKLSLSDLDRKEKDLDITVAEKDGVTVLTHEVASNGIVYADLVLDLAVVPVEYIPILPLFEALLFDVGTSKMDAASFTRKIGARTGGIGVGKINALKIGKDGAVGDPNDIVFRLDVHGKSTADQVDDLFDLMLAGISDSKLDSKERALEILRSSKAGMESALRSKGNSFASTRVLARRSLAGYMDEITTGITYFESLPGLLERAEKDWPTLVKEMEAICTLLLQKKAILINLSADKKTLQKIDASVGKFVQSVVEAGKKRQQADVKGPFVADAMKGEPLLRLKEEDEGFVVSTQVNYVVWGGALFGQGDQISGTTEVVVRLISQSYMWDKVRVMGGAYGGGCSLSHHSGTFSCYSYRDPNLKETLDVFDSVAAHLESLSLDHGAIEQLVIGAVGDLDKPMTPSSKGYVSMARWLLNDSLEIRQKRRDEMFSTTAESFAAFAKHMRKSKASWRSSIFGSRTAFTKANAAFPEGHQLSLKELH